MSIDQFHSLEIKDIRQETATAVSILFDVPDHLASMFRFKPGQHITLRADLDGEEVRRTYSLCAAPGDGELRIAIKQVAGGQFSNWANAQLIIGDRLDVMAPRGSFTRDFDSERPVHYLGIAGGSGITPILSLLKSALTAGHENRFTLLYGNRDGDSIMFLEKLAELKNRYMERLQVYHVLSDEEQDLALFNGQFDAAKCTEIFGSITDPDDADTIFICGPGIMMDEVEKALLARGVPAANLMFERFASAAPSAALVAQTRTLIEEASGRGFSVILDGRKRSATFSGDATNLLDSARSAGFPVPFACKAGVCATCRAKVVSGEVRMGVNYALSAEEVAAGYVLTCQSVPVTDGVVLDYDA